MTNYFIKIKSFLFPQDRTEAIRYLENVYSECLVIRNNIADQNKVNLQAYMELKLTELHADIEEYKKETERYKRRYR